MEKLSNSASSSGLGLGPDHRSPSPSRLRQRPLARSATFGDSSLLYNRRRNSLISDNASDARRSLRSSTDNLLLPKAEDNGRLSTVDDTSHWHSVPLGLALLPAVSGLFFHNGGPVVTDITLLALAGIFLNWSVRLPWDWYRSAQATKTVVPADRSSFDTIIEEDSDDKDGSQSQQRTPSPDEKADKARLEDSAARVRKARTELQVHELVALASCFLFPAVGAWMLHAIRGQLSRPSEGLVSNYNLTVFLLASEIRPISHLVTMIQSRTLFLQRTVNSSPSEEGKYSPSQFADIANRLEELEAHVAESAEAFNEGVSSPSELPATKAVARAVAESRKALQPELNALNRAVRRYEKRTTISSLQTESRLQDLESRLKDVVVLAAAAQRNADNQNSGFSLVLLNWLCGAIVLPIQYAWYLVHLPLWTLQSAGKLVQRNSTLRRGGPSKDIRQGRSTQPKPGERRSKVGS